MTLTIASILISQPSRRGSAKTTRRWCLAVLCGIAAHNNHLNAQFNLAVLLSHGGTVKANPREAYFWALAAQHTARTRPQGALTFDKVTKLVKQIRSTLPHQAASQATRAAWR